MKRLYIFLIPVFFSCSSPGEFNLNRPLYRLSGSDAYLYFTADSARWISDLYRNDIATFPYRISGNSIYLIYGNNQFDELLVRRNELIFNTRNDTLSRVSDLTVNGLLKLTRVTDKEAEFLFNRIKLLQEMRSKIISSLKNSVAHTPGFRLASKI